MKIMNKALLKKRRILGRGKMSDQWENVKREIAIMKQLDHPNIVRLHEVLDDDRSEKLYLALEYVEGGALSDGEELETQPIPEDQARIYFRDLIMGLEYCKQLEISLHRPIGFVIQYMLARLCIVMSSLRTFSYPRTVTSR
jgi:serine/threonine protein kinase